MDLFPIRNPAKVRAELLAHARGLRRAAVAWLQEQTSATRSGNVGRDCTALGWPSPDAMLRAAESTERDAALLVGA